MKVLFACLLVVCLSAMVHAQARTNPLVAASLFSGATGRGGGLFGGGNNLLALGALSGGLGGDAIRDFTMCRMLFRTNPLMCMTMMQ